jgi:two-component system, NarL family, response regulator LiaR
MSANTIRNYRTTFAKLQAYFDWPAERELCLAIRAAAAGQVPLSPKAAERLMREVRAPKKPEVLTARETEVLRLMAQGLANKEIARALNIGEKTVKTHISNVLAKLGVPSRTQAALYAARFGLVNLHSETSESLGSAPHPHGAH